MPLFKKNRLVTFPKSDQRPPDFEDKINVIIWTTVGRSSSAVYANIDFFFVGQPCDNRGQLHVYIFLRR